MAGEKDGKRSGWLEIEVKLKVTLACYQCIKRLHQDGLRRGVSRFLLPQTFSERLMIMVLFVEVVCGCS